MSVSRKTMQENTCPVLIETGTYHGDFIQKIKDLKFEKIISIEVSNECCEFARRRFVSDKNVSIVNGDSVKTLWSIIENIKKKIVFVLDAHCCDWGGDTRLLDEKDKRQLTTYPLVQELEVIGRHSQKDHTIIIDDVRLFESHFSTTLVEVTQTLLNINSSYRTDLVSGLDLDGVYVLNDVLVAKV